MRVLNKATKTNNVLWRCADGRQLRKHNAVECQTCRILWQQAMDRSYVHGVKQPTNSETTSSHLLCSFSRWICWPATVSGPAATASIPVTTPEAKRQECWRQRKGSGQFCPVLVPPLPYPQQAQQNAPPLPPPATPRLDAANALHLRLPAKLHHSRSCRCRHLRCHRMP